MSSKQLAPSSIEASDLPSIGEASPPPVPTEQSKPRPYLKAMLLWALLCGMCSMISPKLGLTTTFLIVPTLWMVRLGRAWNNGISWHLPGNTAGADFRFTIRPDSIFHRSRHRIRFWFVFLMESFLWLLTVIFGVGVMLATLAGI